MPTIIDIFVFQVRGIFSFKDKCLAIGQTIAYIGKEDEHPGTNIGHFGDDSMKYRNAISPVNILDVRRNGYLAILLFQSELTFQQIDKLQVQPIFNGLIDGLFVRGSKASDKCKKLPQLLSMKIPSNLMHIMDDISGTGVSLSNCLGEQISLPYWSKLWRLTTPTPGKENECPGRVQPNLDVAMADISVPSVPEDISDDCNAVSPAAFSKKRRLDETLQDSSASGSSCPVQVDGEMADIDMRQEANEAIVKRLNGDVETNPSWCPKHNFDSAWINHIESHQSNILPLAGKYKHCIVLLLLKHEAFEEKTF